MKRIFSFFAACATFFAVAACQDEMQPVEQQPVLDGIEGELTQVTFSVNLDDKGQTKAISDGLKADRLEYAVYYADDRASSKYQIGDYVAVLSDDDAVANGIAKIEENGDKNWKVTLTLAKNVKYDIVFWASAADAPYTFDEPAAQIIVNDDYTGDANAENRDAFYGICKGYSVISSDTKVELRRPFAQINFGSGDYVPYVTDLGLKMTSKIDTKAHDKVEEVRDAAGNLLYPERPAVAKCTVPNTLNVLDGTVEGEAVVDFQLTKIPYETAAEDDDLDNDKDMVLMTGKKDGKDVVYHWMGMNYILAGAESTINNIHATFHYNGQDLTFDVPNVPYKRNFKTNIVGNLFTGAAKFNVVVVPEYAGADIVVDLDELEALNPIERAIKLAVDGNLADAAAVLSNDLTIDKTIEVPAGLNLSIDLGGKRLTSTVAPAILAKGNLTLSNGATATVGELVRAAEGVEIALNGVKALSGDDYAAGDNCVFVPVDAKNVTVTIDKDSELKSFGAAVIQSNGNTEGLVLNVAGKITSVGEVAMYLPQVETCTIASTAVISGATGIELRAGNLIVEDGASVSATENTLVATPNGNGSTVVGAAIAVSAHSTNLPINVEIKGGVFSCAYALYEVNFNEGRTAKTELAVNGGKFNAPIYSQNCKGFITAGTFAEKVEVPAEYLAEGLMVGEDGVVVEKPEPAIELALVTTEAVPAEGGKVVVKVTANVAWTLTLDEKVVKTGAAVSEAEVEVEVAANELEEIVEHKLVLSAEGVEPKDVKFNQAAKVVAPVGPTVVTVAEFLAAAEDETIEYQVSGMITKIYAKYNSQYNNIAFYLKDATGEMLVYRMSCEGIENPEAIAPGDQITVKGTRAIYEGKPQMAQGGACVEYTPFVAQASEWGVVGDLNEWGKTADVVMYNTWHTADLYVAYNVEIASGAFKIRANNSWDDNSKNYGLHVAGNIYADKYYEVYSDGGSNNVTPMAYGTYDVYFDLANNRVALMTPGKAYVEAVDGGQPIVVVAGLKDHAWGVIGSFEASNGWAVDVEMSVEGDYAVAKNVTLANGDSFKIRSDKSWDTPNYGTGSDVNVGDVYTTYKSGGDMKFVGETGAYNLYFSLIDASFYMEAYVEAPAVEETTATVTFDNTAKRTSMTNTQAVWEENGITVTNDKANSTNNIADYSKPARFYKGSNLTVDVDGMITSISFACNTAAYATELQKTIGDSALVNAKVVSVTLDEPVSSFVVENLTGQVRMDSVTVTYLK